MEKWLEAHPNRIAGRVLVPGCGLGHDIRTLVKSGVEDVIGMDLSPTAIAMAREIPAAGAEKYLVEDLFEWSEQHEGEFDWIFEHTLYCAIEPDDRDRYATAVSRVLRPGGTMLALFYLDPYDDEHQPGEGPPHGCTEEELRERFAGSGLFEWVKSEVPTVAYPGREERELLVELRRR